jgi:hypothetical protein
VDGDGVVGSGRLVGLPREGKFILLPNSHLIIQPRRNYYTESIITRVYMQVNALHALGSNWVQVLLSKLACLGERYCGNMRDLGIGYKLDSKMPELACGIYQKKKRTKLFVLRGN